MTATEQVVLKSLIELHETVKAMPTTNPKPDLLPLFARLEELTGELTDDASPELLHYLRKKSYDKARLWLEGRRGQIARGGCLGD